MKINYIIFQNAELSYKIYFCFIFPSRLKLILNLLIRWVFIEVHVIMTMNMYPWFFFVFELVVFFLILSVFKQNVGIGVCLAMSATTGFHIKKTCIHFFFFIFNSLRPSDAIWWHRFGSTLARVMVCCLTAPSHYLNQYWLIISKV